MKAAAFLGNMAIKNYLTDKGLEPEGMVSGEDDIIVAMLDSDKPVRVGLKDGSVVDVFMRIGPDGDLELRYEHTASKPARDIAHLVIDIKGAEPIDVYMHALEALHEFIEEAGIDPDDVINRLHDKMKDMLRKAS